MRTTDGRTVEVPVPEPLRDRIDVGTSVEMDERGGVDWRLPGDAARERSR